MLWSIQNPHSFVSSFQDEPRIFTYWTSHSEFCQTNQFYQESINGGAVGSSAVKKSNLKTEKAHIYDPLVKEETLEGQEQEDQELVMQLENEENNF